MGFGRGGRRSKMKERNQGASLFDVEGKAMAFLAQRDYSVSELRKKLHDRGFPNEHIEATIERYLELGYLDDERAAASLMRVLVRQCWGPMQIRNKMRQRGFSPEIIDEALAEHEESEWLESAAKRLRSKYRKEPSEFDQKEREQAFRHLTYRGFSGFIARQLLFQ